MKKPALLHLNTTSTIISSVEIGVRESMRLQTTTMMLRIGTTDQKQRMLRCICQATGDSQQIHHFGSSESVAHGMDTNVNESFNNTISWLAPKNKEYCGTQSLQNRLLMGIGIQGLGLLGYFRRLLSKLGIIVTPKILHFLSVKQSKRAMRIDKVKKTNIKKQRLQSKFEQLRKDKAIAKKERA